MTKKKVTPKGWLSKVQEVTTQLSQGRDKPMTNEYLTNGGYDPKKANELNERLLKKFNQITIQNALDAKNK